MGDQSTNNDDSTGTRRKFDEMEDDVLTLDEFIRETELLEENAVAVLGGSDEINCSYDKGYVKRQALYSCLTCNPQDSNPYTAAGICLACSMKCHAGHDLVELYTKRNFRCDCGNKKFPRETHCQLQPIKSDYNAENKYNQNFKGLYCICARPYPDPDEEDEDEEDDDDDMIQCVICEDWYHGRHTENDEIDFDLISTCEFVCKSCSQKHPFLAHYGKFIMKCAAVTAAKETESGAANRVDEPKGLTDDISVDVATTDEENGSCTPVSSQDSGIVSNGETADQDSSSQGDPLMPLSDPKMCFLESNAVDTSLVDCGTWWVQGWRLQLCKCENCLAKYDSAGVQFLVDPEDPLEVYEALGRQRDQETPVLGGELMSALGRMNHVQKMEIVHGVNELKEGLLELTRRVNAAGRAMTPQDVETFFAELRSKRRRVDPDLPPDNCR